MDNSEVIVQQPTCTPRDTVIVGAAAGLTAGFAMAMWAMLTSIWHGVDILAPFEAIGATFMGPNATNATFFMTLYGVLVHAVVSATLGILFVALLPQPCSCRYACAAGIGFSVAVLLAMTYVLLPVVNPVMQHAVAAIPKSWVIQHALFGATMAVVPAYWKYYRAEGNEIVDALRLTGYARKWSLVRRREPAGEVVTPHAAAKVATAPRRALKHVEVFDVKHSGRPAVEREALPRESAEIDGEITVHVHRINRKPTQERPVRHVTPRLFHPGTDRVATMNRIGVIRK